MSLLLLLPLRHALRLIFRQPSSDGASLLWAEVERDVLLSLVEDSQLRSLICVDDCEDASNRFADVVAVALLLASYSRNVPSTPKHQRRMMGSHILFNFDDAPPAIFCVRSCTSSCLSSSSCFDRSSLFFPHSCAAFTFDVFED